MERRDKRNYYLDLAEMVSKRSTCLRRAYGAVIVKNDEVISTGYVGAPRGRANCSDMGYCIRAELKIPRGERYELCRSVHAEANAIISASRDKMIDSTMYLTGVEPDGRSAVIGPAKSFVGLSMTAHEFGGMYRGRKYPRRELMGPALAKSAPELPKLWRDAIR